MKDDYLWDGSGEPDAEIEKLEGLLGRYRSERPAPELPETPVIQFRPRRAVFVPYAAAAAVLLMLSLGVWLMVRSGGSQPPQIAKNTSDPTVTPGTTTTGVSPQPNVVKPPEGDEPGKITAIVPVKDRPRHPKTSQPKVDTPQPAPAPEPETKFRPLVDVATAAHIQQAEILLRSFRNASADDADAVSEVAFDSQQSRELLDQNTMLRNAAKTKKNLVASQLLGDIEPYLIDIASLGDKPSRDDVREIQQRLEQRDVVDDLSLYSMNRPSQGF